MLENTSTDIPHTLLDAFARNGQLDISNFGPLKGCFSIGRSFPFWLWIAPLIFETLLCLLMVNKVWEVYRRDYRSPLLKAIVIDRWVDYECLFIHGNLTCLTQHLIFFTVSFFMTKKKLPESYSFAFRIFSLLLGSCLLWSIESKRLNNLVQLTVPCVLLVWHCPP